uniref:Endonuclease VIII-like 1 DNA binding domain-containing protein n=1 Tax=Hucho hucho TaxID=62062 RepID=A0A4W5KWK9_9TELE
MDYSEFKSWLQCYCVDGMKSVRDHNGRTMWFKGDPGPMTPKDAISPKAKMTVKKEDDHGYTGGEKVKKARSESTMKPKYIKKTVTKEKEVPQRRAGSRKCTRLSTETSAAAPQTWRGTRNRARQ